MDIETQRPMLVLQEFNYTSTEDATTKTAVVGAIVTDVHPRHYDWKDSDGLPLLVDPEGD